MRAQCRRRKRMGDVEHSKQMTVANPAYDPERRGDFGRLPAAGASAPPQQPVGTAAKVHPAFTYAFASFMFIRGQACLRGAFPCIRDSHNSVLLFLHVSAL